MALYAICRLNDIPSMRARGFVLGRRYEDGAVRPWHVFVIRWGRNVVGYENRCPHEGVNLDWERGQFFDGNGTRILCGKHGALFDLGTGECVEGPCIGATLTSIELVVDDGDICVSGVMLDEDEDDDSGCGVE